ncbi:ATP synthase subunit I [Acidobacteriota bacterium]
MNLKVSQHTVEDKILRRIPYEIVLVAAILAIVCYFIFDWILALLFFCGGIISSISFIWLNQSLSKLLISGKKEALKSSILLYSLRLLLIIGLIFIIIFFFSKKILAFIAGFSTTIIVFLIEAVIAYFNLKRWNN